MDPLELVGLGSLMQRTSGRPEITVGVIDGPVLLNHPSLAGKAIREVPGRTPVACSNRNSVACVHGTFVMGMLAANRDSGAPAICPSCSFLLRPIFSEPARQTDEVPGAAPEVLAAAIIDCVRSGARILNLSLGLANPSATGERELEEALSYAGQKGVISVAAAGNQGVIASSALTRHPAVIPVVACVQSGRPAQYSNLAPSAGRRGVSAPGEGVTSLGTEGRLLSMRGTSAAAPFVTGAIALLWSEFPWASARDIRRALTQSVAHRRRSLVPPMLNAQAAYEALAPRGSGVMAAKVGANSTKQLSSG